MFDESDHSGLTDCDSAFGNSLKLGERNGLAGSVGPVGLGESRPAQLVVLESKDTVSNEGYWSLRRHITLTGESNDF